MRSLSVIENLKEIKAKVEEACEKSKRKPEEITLIAVTKYVDNDRAQEVVDLGVHHIGENRDDQFLKKQEAIGEQAVWHFVGTLQSRKVRNIIHKVDYIHSLDRLSLAKEINKRADKPIKCFVQVNVSGEKTKHGLAVEEVLPFVEKIEPFENIKVIGLMTMAEHTDDEAVIRETFRKLKSLQEEVIALNISNAPCEHLSMGMSNDYTIAIEEGATFIRIGSSLVGTNT